MSAINIYSVPQVAQLTVAGVNARAHMITSSAYNRSTFRMFRRVQNDFDFLIRDIDRQPVALQGDVVFHVWDDNGNTIFEKNLSVVNPLRAHYRLVVTEAETLPIRSGLYMWSVSNTNTAITKLLYTNSDYGSRGFLEVGEGLLTLTPDPQTILPGGFSPDLGEFHSSGLIGAALAGNATGNHSAAIYLTNFTGTLTVEATLNESPGGWVEIDSVDYTNYTGTDPVNFVGNFTYTRFRITSLDGLQKIVYRN